jgi:hypothetical protein
MMILRPSIWRRLYQQACEILKKSTNPVEMTTWDMIERKKVEVLPFIQFRKEDYFDLRAEYPAKKRTVLSRTFPPTIDTIKQLENDWSGRIYGNRIYICAGFKSVDKMKNTLVHEINHFLNHSNDHFTTKADQFREELRALLAEKATKPRPLTRLQVKLAAEKVAKDYELPLPKKITLPDGHYYLPAHPRKK